MFISVSGVVHQAAVCGGAAAWWMDDYVIDVIGAAEGCAC